jgi:hypothetical protein
VSSLATWAVWEIVAACSLLGSVIALLVVLAVAVLDRWISMAREASRRPVLEPAQSEPAVLPPLGSLPTRLACAQLGLPGLREGPASNSRGMLATRQRDIASASLTPDLPDPVQAPAIVPAAEKSNKSSSSQKSRPTTQSVRHTRPPARRICCLYTISTPLHDNRDGATTARA